jgi:hypothetical protein
MPEVQEELLAKLQRRLGSRVQTRQSKIEAKRQVQRTSQMKNVRVINYDLDNLPYHTKLFGLCLWVCSVESLRDSVESLRVTAEYRLRSLDGVWLVNRTNTLGFETSKFKLLQN